jgi:hypothetical protein
MTGADAIIGALYLLFIGLIIYGAFSENIYIIIGGFLSGLLINIDVKK